MCTIDAIREIHDMNRCGRQEYKGINYTSDTKTLVLIHNNRAPYNDSFDGEVLYYDGEGLPEKGDQRMAGANKKLLEDDVKCYVYWENESGTYDYLGKFIVEDVEEDTSTGRLVYKFELHKLIERRYVGWCSIQ